ncbi:MAG: winged helix-turn-helix domain-containing protein [Candidatus Anstonellales archaeon]
MGDEVIVDRELLRAIDADTRINILKSLYKRRKTQSELSEELKLSPPTVLEHVEKLERAGLVKRIEEGRKWKYYELTPKGRKLISPERKPITAIIMLAVGLLFIWYALFVSPSASVKQESSGMALKAMDGAGEELVYEESGGGDFVRILSGIVGFVLISAGLVKLRENL